MLTRTLPDEERQARREADRKLTSDACQGAARQRRLAELAQPAPPPSGPTAWRAELAFVREIVDWDEDGALEAVTEFAETIDTAAE